MSGTILFLLLFSFLSARATADGGEGKKPEGWRSGIGSSALENPARAGEEAARKAKEGLGDVPAKFVMVAAAEPLVTGELLDGVKKHFPADLIYGCEAASPWTPDGNYPDSRSIDSPLGVGVWALGGDTDIEIATVSTAGSSGAEDDPYFYAGLDLAWLLQDFLESNKRPGKLILTWGDQFTGSNKDFARGMNEGFWNTWPIIGAAAGNAEAKVVVRGEIVHGMNVGVVLAGDFKVGMSLRRGVHLPQTAGLAVEDALKSGEGEEPFFGLVFNCRRRRFNMIENKLLAEEHAAVAKQLPKDGFFGFYGPGEIGATETGKPAEGIGFSVVTALLFPL